jgi:CysZ protein
MTSPQTPSEPSFFRKALRSFWQGATVPARALGLLFRHPALLLFCLIPIGIALVLQIWLFGTLSSALGAWASAALLARGLAAGSWILTLAQGLTSVVSLFLGALSLGLTSALVALPFNDLLAEQTEARVAPPLTPTPFPGLRKWLANCGRDLFKTVFALVGSVFLLVVGFLLSWLPLLPLLFLWLNSLLLTLQFLSFPRTRRGFSLFADLRYLRANLAVLSGFGGISLILLSIPLLSILALPLLIVSGTLLFAELESPFIHSTDGK